MLKSQIRNFIIKAITEERLLRWLNIKNDSFPINIFEKYGYFETLKTGKPIDFDGNHLPWFTYPAIEYLIQLDFSDKTVLEWGCGNSSIFFANRVAFIDSIEDNKEWYDEIKEKLPSNAALHFVNNENYIDILNILGKKYDVIIIDAKRRDECANIAYKFLNNHGIIIFDNSDWFKNSSKILREKDFIQVDFHGFGPINDYTWTTSIFFSRTVELSSIDGVQPKFAIGGIHHICD